MSFKVKKNILLVISIINVVICFVCAINNFIDNGFVIGNIIRELFFILLALTPILLITFNKKFKHLYYLIVFYALAAFVATQLSIYLLNVASLIVCFFETIEEKGKLVKVIKRHPIIMSLTTILAGVSMLSFSSVFEFISQLTYGSSVLGELIATIFLFGMIWCCKKGYLLYRNKGSINEAIAVSLPFLIYSLYIGSGLIAIHMVEGYNLVSIENIITIIILYLLVGIFEDFLTRGLSLNILLDRFGKTKRGIWMSVILSSLFFGLIHFVNLFTGASFEGVLIQVIAATCVGMYFAAIYLRSGNVWVPALLHGLYDIAVSVGSFFIVKEVVDVSADYGTAISNYSWSNVLIGIIFILLTLFLLRKKKMNEVYLRFNSQEVAHTKSRDISNYILLGLVFGCGISFCFSSANGMFQLEDYSRSLYNKLPIDVIYNSEIGSIYQNGNINYNSLSDEAKIFVAIYNTGKLQNIEGSNLSEVITYIEDYEIEKSMKEIFNIDQDINYVNLKYSSNTTCNYEEDTFRYKCITIGDEISSNVRVYSNISKITLSKEATVELTVYYMVEDLNSKILYADSNRKTIYRYNTLVSDISDGVLYDESDSENKLFWENIKKNNNGKIPTYKISLELNDFGTGVYFLNSDFIDDSIENTITISEDKYVNDSMTFSYDRELFELKDINNYLTINYNDDVVLKIEKVSSDLWLKMYQDDFGYNINLGNNTYYKVGGDYLIYKDNFYLISIITEDLELENKLVEIIKTLEFK